MRIDRVNQLVKREVSIIIQKEMEDPRLEFVSVSRVEVSRDLHHAKVFFSVLGDEKGVGCAQDGLNGARGFIRKRIGQRLRLKFTPDLNFFYDNSLEFNIRFEQDLERLKNEDKDNS